MKKHNSFSTEHFSRIQNLRQKFADDQNYFQRFYQDLFERLKKSQDDNDNFFTQIYFPKIKYKIHDGRFWQQNRHKKLFGIPFSLKDNFLLKNKKTTAGSHILSNFVSDFDTPVLKWLEKEGAILLGKNTIDELGLGGTGLLAQEGPVYNPHNSDYIIGGSSSGSAAAVAMHLSCFALGTDTGDSTRIVSAYAGVVGFKPSFGMISRRGLIPYAPSFDTVGLITNSVFNLSILTNVLFRYDRHDGASQSPNSLVPIKENLSSKSFRLAYFSPTDHLLDEKVLPLFKKYVLEKLVKSGFQIEPIQIEKRIINSLALIYQILSYPEAISTQANLTGVYFGKATNASNLTFAEQVIQNRSQGFGYEIKRRYLIGSLFMDQLGYEHFYRAQNIRQFLIEYFRKLWKKYDFIFHPATFSIAPTVKKIQKQTSSPSKHQAIMNDYLIIGNFIGVPSLTLPYANYQGLPLAINLYAPIKHDLLLIKFGETLEQFFNYSFPPSQ